MIFSTTSIIFSLSNYFVFLNNTAHNIFLFAENINNRRVVMKRCICIFLAIMLCFGISRCFLPNEKVFADSQFSDFSSKSYVLVDKSTGEVLFDKNANQKMQVASICKLMTSLITLENIENGKLNLDDKLIASEHACSMEGSQAFLDAGSEYTVRDLLKSVIVASANDSAVVLAEHIGGSEKEFVGMMNKRAKELEMDNTIYANATGLEAPNQYSTAIDTAKILAKISEFGLYKDDCKIWMDDFVHPGGRVTQLVNTNRLIKYYSSCVGGKTGFTDDAGYCLSACAEKNNMSLIAVTLKCKDSASRFRECMDLLNYGFGHYENAVIIKAGEIVPNSICVLQGRTNAIKLIFEKDFNVLKKRGDNLSITTNINLPREIKAPLKSGDIVGSVDIMKNGVIIGKVNIISAETIEKHNYKDVIEKIYDKWSVL